MGIEHYLVCKQCKQYIDLHKAYCFGMTLTQPRPSPGVEGNFSPWGYVQDIKLNGTYWETRGLWFLWQHRGHKDVELWTDDQDEWFGLKPHLEEVFKHADDLKLREKKKS